MYRLLSTVIRLNSAIPHGTAEMTVREAGMTVKTRQVKTLCFTDIILLSNGSLLLIRTLK